MANDFNSIQISGALLSNEFVLSCTRPGGTFDAFAASTFDPSWKRDEAFERGLTHAWESARDRFDAIERDLPGMDVSDVRERWILPLLRLLGFRPVYQKANTHIPGTNLSFRISHRGWDGPEAPAIQVLAPAVELDTKPAERGAKSPQADLQEYLNQDTSQTWAMLTNGLQLRLLRDYFHTSQAGYVQFDLVQMFLTRDLDEFRALFRLAHASRWLPMGSDATIEEAEAGEADLEPDDDTDDADAVDEDVDEPKRAIRLEHYYQHSRAQGSRAEGDLRGSVKNALEVLGDGLLDDELRARLEDQGQLDEYYRQLLRVVYRCIFLLFAEQRGLVPNGQAEHAQLYLDEYSLTALRDLAEETSFVRDDDRDLWERLLLTFELAHRGSHELGIQAFNGALFDPARTELITGGVTDPAERNERTDLPSVDNPTMVRFIEHLAFVERKGLGRERINYRDLRVEEIGHIYEGLLDYAPRIAGEDVELEDRIVPRGAFFLDDRGTERKTSGSYYTPKDLVQEVIGRTLLPVMDARLDEAGSDPKAQEKALLDIRVLDPACGSAAFLIAANDALATRLADVRWDAARQERMADRAETLRLQGTTALFREAPDDRPRLEYEDELKRAKRDVLSHCIYGVDLNDMAVELAKVALWIHAAESGKPLSFLDHRIRHGNSLIGAPLDFVGLGVHPDAFKGRGDQDKERLKKLRKVFTPKQVANHRKRQAGLFDLDIELPDLDSIREQRVEDVRRKRDLFEAYRHDEAYTKWRRLADYWTAAFFHPVRNDALHVPNQKGLSTLLQSYETIVAGDRPGTEFDTGLWERVDELREEYTFFHHWLEFPEAFFDEHGKRLETAGFDAIVGNPPWERVKLQEKEFFASRDPLVADAPNAAKRKQRIRELATRNPTLLAEFEAAQARAEATSNFLRVSGRYPLGGVGDVNTYQVFTEHARDITSPRGRTGIIVPSGVATDNTTKDLFRDFIESRSLVSLDDFENRKKLFMGVDSRMKFCILVLTAPGSGPEAAEFSFFNTRVEHLSDLRRKFQLTPEDFKKINPNTLTCPTFRTGRDAEITLKMYERAGVFVDENDPENGNPWGVDFLRMFDMSNDSGLFRTAEQLATRGCELKGNTFLCASTAFRPLYEGRMVHFYDHRPVSIGKAANAQYRTAASIDTTDDEHEDPSFVPLPRYWVDEQEFEDRLPSEAPRWARACLLAFKDITSATNQRTVIASLIPSVPAGHSLPTIMTAQTLGRSIALLANLNSLPLDFVARQKVGGLHLTYFYLEQFPLLAPDRYSDALLEEIIPAVFELTYTTWDMKPFADELWGEASSRLQGVLERQATSNAEATARRQSETATDLAGAACPLRPFRWDVERRHRLRARLDAVFARLYGLHMEELEWILDPRNLDSDSPSRTFSGLRRAEERQYGEYRTRRFVLEQFEAVSAMRFPESPNADAVVPGVDRA